MKNLFYLMLLVFGVATFASCSKDDDDKESISFTVKNDELSLNIYTFKKGDVVVINWGDGTETEYTAVYEEYDSDEYTGEWDVWGEVCAKHDYEDEKTYKVTIKGAIRAIDLESQNLTELDVTRCGELEGLLCNYNKLEKLDVSKCRRLRKLSCSNNELTELDVTRCSALKNLSCSSNKLKTLDATGCSELEELFCSNNELDKLVVLGCSNLETLNCGDNKLKALDIKDCLLLESLICYQNGFDKDALEAIFKALPERKKNDEGYLRCDWVENLDESIAEKKNWNVSAY